MVMMMFRWLRKRLGASSLISETETTLNDVRRLSEATQRVTAKKVCKEIVRSLRQIEGTPGPISPERDQVIRDQLIRAKATRHQALNRGAKNGADPDWAAAAVVEGWLIANSGALGPKAFNQITGLTMDWLRSTLSDSDFEEIEKL
jgi:hypothetical protein